MTTDELARGARGLDEDFTRRALDELFALTTRYRSSTAYLELLRFVTRFRSYSPYNAMLVHVQLPGARFVAPPLRWLREFARRVRLGARPLVILQPMGPVMFVFDVSDTEPMENGRPLPPEVENPFEVRAGQIRNELSMTIENAKRDGVRVTLHDAGSQNAGSIRAEVTGESLKFVTRRKTPHEHVGVPMRYHVLLNSRHSNEAQYATLVHELAHLYCGHLGSPDPKWWRDRRGMAVAIKEFEAESVSFLVCGRLGINTPSAEYLIGFESGNAEVPAISVEAITRAAGLIEQMGREWLPLRKGSTE